MQNHHHTKDERFHVAGSERTLITSNIIENRLGLVDQIRANHVVDSLGVTAYHQSNSFVLPISCAFEKESAAYTSIEGCLHLFGPHRIDLSQGCRKQTIIMSNEPYIRHRNSVSMRRHPPFRPALWPDDLTKLECSAPRRKNSLRSFCAVRKHSTVGSDKVEIIHYQWIYGSSSTLNKGHFVSSALQCSSRVFRRESARADDDNRMST